MHMYGDDDVMMSTICIGIKVMSVKLACSKLFADGVLMRCTMHTFRGGAQEGVPCMLYSAQNHQ